MRILKDLLFAFAVIISCIIVASIITDIVWADESEDDKQTIISLEELKESVINKVIKDFYRSDIPLDLPTQRLLFEACKEFNVDYELALAVIWRETIFQNIYAAEEGSSGYMMIQERWVKKEMEELGATDLMNPKDNFRVGCYLLSDFIGRYGVEGGLTRYNTGHSGSSWYANSVIGKWMELKTMHEN